MKQEKVNLDRFFFCSKNQTIIVLNFNNIIEDFEIDFNYLM